MGYNVEFKHWKRKEEVRIRRQRRENVSCGRVEKEGLYNLCEALRALDIEDDDLYALEASVRAIRGD